MCAPFGSSYSMPNSELMKAICSDTSMSAHDRPADIKPPAYEKKHDDSGDWTPLGVMVALELFEGGQ